MCLLTVGWSTSWQRLPDFSVRVFLLYSALCCWIWAGMCGDTVATPKAASMPHPSSSFSGCSVLGSRPSSLNLTRFSASEVYALLTSVSLDCEGCQPLCLVLLADDALLPVCLTWMWRGLWAKTLWVNEFEAFTCRHGDPLMVTLWWDNKVIMIMTNHLLLRLLLQPLLLLILLLPPPLM